MKKTILLLLIIFILCGCTKKEVNTLNNTPEPTPTKTVTPTPYIDDNPVKVGLYQNGKLVTNLTTSIINGVDIASFDVYFTSEENVGSSNTKYNFNKYYNNYENPSNYKIGFTISFETTNKSYNETFTKPNVYATNPYIYNYLYDDVHQADGAWYSHLEETDVKDNTVYSSIKLYAAEKTEEITSPVTLTVFTYDTEDDFDEDGHYRGNSKHTLVINKK